MDIRAGTGIDFHILVEDESRPLLLGGIKIPGILALKGHSDSDVILHAVADAILGALGEGDIGDYFPDTDPELKDMDSGRIIKHAMELISKKGFRISNCDITLIAEKPRISIYKPSIIKSVADLLSIDQKRIGLKATTTEKMGALGRGEGVSCIATVLLISD
ncbi:MAG: 2-C-methyl-D-erythritol 2,4-cyclodiphosphate synthase [Spirochaetia bacterium]|nr:2-C-methyl-D-erythritol 2,4-cyclodiphosphate synthase [Spirochaetia bacterium]